MPADREEIREQIIRLAAVMPNQKSDDEWEVLIDTYCEDLVGVPSKVIDYACRMIRRYSQWWPSLAEVLEGCREEIISISNIYKRLLLLSMVRSIPAPEGIATRDWIDKLEAEIQRDYS